MGKRVADMTPEERERARANARARYAAKDPAARRATANALYAANREHIRKQRAERRVTNLEHANAKCRAYYAANRERMNAYDRARHAAHPERKRGRYAANCERLREQSRTRSRSARATDPEREYERCLLYRAANPERVHSWEASKRRRERQAEQLLKQIWGAEYESRKARGNVSAGSILRELERCAQAPPG
jgi:hypothetical protein